MINNIWYANDIAVIANGQENVQKLLRIVVTKSENLGLTLNMGKTKTIVINKGSL